MRPAHQSWLDTMNDAVTVVDPAGAQSDGPGVTVLVTGVPRSGTTLALQSMQELLPVTVVDHLAAAFWRNPALGVALSQQLRDRTTSDAMRISYESSYGVTPNWYEPHEFSYFWRDALGWASPHVEPDAATLSATDFAVAARLLEAAAAVAPDPLATKAFPLLWAGEQFLEASPRAILIVMQRDREAVRRSYKRARPAADEPWFSLRPQGWSEMLEHSIDDQLDFQVDALIGASHRLVSSGHERIIAVSLDQLISDRMGCVESIRKAITQRMLTS